MKRTYLFFGLVGIVILFAGNILLVSESPATAQISDEERAKQQAWDKSVTKEKLTRVREEALSTRDAIKKSVDKQFPRLKFDSESFSDPGDAGLGRKGQSIFYLSWKRKQARYSLTVTFFFDPDEAGDLFHKSINSISMGEFFPAPGFLGKTSVLVKNVNYNRSMTNVGLHFTKGRLLISSHLTNHKKTAAQNEKILIEFMKVVEPMLTAKLTFEEV